MLARIRKSVDEKDEGFTLVELLVVMIIIGILAAVAIPTFANQKKKAYDTSAKSDLKNVVTDVQAFLTDNTAPAATTYSQTSGAFAPAALTGVNTNLSTNTTVKVTFAAIGDTTFTACSSNSQGTMTGGANENWFYNSANGGSITKGVNAC